MKYLLSTVAALAFSAPISAAELFVVTSAADSGEGSLRAALMAASASPDGGAVAIDLPSNTGITINSGLVYSGTAPLELLGKRTTVTASGNFTLLSVSNGADLFVREMSFQGPGGFHIENRGDLSGPAGKGIFVDMRDDQTGVVRVELQSVKVSDVAGHGIHVSDCSLADDCGGGEGGAGEGSPAGVDMRLIDVSVSKAGTGSFDADGIRVDERGAGDVVFDATVLSVQSVGADGVELDEGQEGDVIVRVTGSAFETNGWYCHPDTLNPFMPSEPEGEFAAGAMAEKDIPASVTGSPDDRCIEREVDLHDDGSVEEYEFSIDTDDGFDIDEAGPGSIRARFDAVMVLGNYDEGLDFDEAGAGDIALTLHGFVGPDNTDDAVKLSEEDAGNVQVGMLNSRANGNGGKGFVFEEEGDGDLSVFGRSISTNGNDDGDTGIEAVQDDAGTGQMLLIDSQIRDGIDADGVDVRQELH